MPLDISSNAIIEKNKLTSDGVWLLLLEIIYENKDSVRVCLNNDRITWDGYVWNPIIFLLTGIVETKDAEVPNISLSLFDPERRIIPTLQEISGAIGSEVIIRTVHSKYLSNTIPENEESTEIINTSIDDGARITFTLGAENLLNKRCPLQKYYKNNCRFIFKRAEVLFTSGGITEITNSHWIEGDTSGDTAKIKEVRLTSGTWGGGDATGKLIIDIINGPFQSENISIYGDISFSVLVQSNAATLSAASSGKCGYTGIETECNRSFARCEELDNKLRFGGFIGVGITGFLK